MLCIAQYCFLFLCVSFTYSILFNTLSGHAIGPYPIAGPKSTQTRHHPLGPGKAYNAINEVLVPEATTGLEVLPEADKQAVLSPELAAAIAAGIIPAPQWGTGGSIRPEPNEKAWNSLLLPSGQQVMSNTVSADSPVVQEIFDKAEVSIVLGVIYSGIFGPSIWLSFSARTALMRHWYSALLGGTSVLLLCAQFCWNVLNLPGFIAFIVAKIVAAPAGMFFFKRPNLGWILGVVWASALGTKIVEVCTGWFQSFFFPAICFCGVAIALELLMKEITQAALTAFGCSYLAIASTSFFLTLFGFQPNAPLDLLSFWTITPNTWISFTQASAVPYSLLGLWGILFTFGFVVQLLRTRQGYTIPFIFIAQRFLPMSPTALDEKN